MGPAAEPAGHRVVAGAICIAVARRLSVSGVTRRDVLRHAAQGQQDLEGAGVGWEPEEMRQQKRRVLTEDEVVESIRFADSASAAGGHFVDLPESDDDLRAALRGEITFDEVVARALERAKR